MKTPCPTGRLYCSRSTPATSESWASPPRSHWNNWSVWGGATNPGHGRLAKRKPAGSLPFRLEKEPTVPEAVRSGADLVSFSGDKLLGGPQAGIIVGHKQIIQLLRRNPLTRALRIDKLTLAALEATLHLYRRPDQALREIPTLRLLSLALPELHRRARRWLGLLRRALGSEIRLEITPTQSQVGGGALPLSAPASYALVLTPQTGTISELEKHLRSREIPIIGRIEKERLLLDLRTLQEADRPVLLRGLKEWISRP